MIWGSCMSLAALLGGWGLLNTKRDKRDKLVGISILLAMLLVVVATGTVMRGNHQRVLQKNKEREEIEKKTNDQTDRM